MEVLFYFNEAKMCLNTSKSYKEIAEHFNCSPTTIQSRFFNTIERLVDFYDFDVLCIDYPHITNDSWRGNGGTRRFYNARKHPEFWSKIISDYENGTKSYYHNLPSVISDSRKISELTVSEFTDLMKSLLSNVK